MFGLKLAAGALAVATVALAIMNYRDAEPAATGVEPANNETVVYRRAAPSQPRSEGADAADQKDEAGAPYPRAFKPCGSSIPIRPYPSRPRRARRSGAR